MPPKPKSEQTDEDRAAVAETLATAEITMGDIMIDQASVPVQVAVARIIRDLPAIQKNDRGDGVSYRFRGIETLIGHLAPLLAKHGVVIIPSTELVTINTEVENSKGKMSGWTEVVLRVTWTIVGPRGDTLTAATLGIGRDNSDKGSNKAQTQAFKYLLMELFAIGDKEDDSDGIPNPDAVAPAPAAHRQVAGPAREVPAAASPTPPAPPSTIDDPERARQQVTEPAAVIARMDALYATLVDGVQFSPSQWTGKVAPVARNVGRQVADLPAMLADDAVWAAVAIKFGVGQG